MDNASISGTNALPTDFTDFELELAARLQAVDVENSPFGEYVMDCPVCKSAVRYYFINFNEKFKMCENKQCEYPFGYEELELVKHDELFGSDEELDCATLLTSHTPQGSVISTAAWSDIDKLKAFDHDDQSDILICPNDAAREAKLKELTRLKEAELQTKKNLLDIKKLNVQLQQTYEDDDALCIKNEKWIKHLNTLQSLSGVQLLKKEEMALIKNEEWRSNDTAILEKIANDKAADAEGNLDLCPEHSSKVLGITWDSVADNLCISTSVDFKGAVTKRSILSTISKIFDPLGLVAPTVLEAKVMMQRSWLHKLSWDDAVPDDVRDLWQAFVLTLHHLKEVQIPRHVICRSPVNLQLHIFVDASELAYGACAYIRSIDVNKEVSVNLLCSKGKVAPLKPLTTPRLELCAALLGSQLLDKILKSMRLTFDSCFLWSDSTIVLGWLGMHPSKLQTFIRNRIAEIQSTCANYAWRHVPTNENPADHISRGLTASTIVHNKLWWNGPQFLSMPESSWPKLNEKNNTINLPEVKSQNTCLAVDCGSGELFPFSRFSDLKRMQRAFAYMARFIHNTRCKSDKRSGPLSAEELDSALKQLILISQKESLIR